MVHLSLQCLPSDQLSILLIGDDKTGNDRFYKEVWTAASTMNIWKNRDWRGLIK